MDSIKLNVEKDSLFPAQLGASGQLTYLEAESGRYGRTSSLYKV